MRSLTTDVLILGAGVAGCTAALILSEHHSVILVDRAETPTARIGESLPGAAKPLLQRLGIIKRFEADGHRPSLGKASVWGSNVLVRSDGFSDPFGPGWCLNRLRFDTMLRDAACERGARLIAPVQLTELTRRADGIDGWSAMLRSIVEDVKLDARFVVLAHGRGTPPSAFETPLAVRASDSLVCRFITAAPALCSDPLADFSVTEAVAEGWWYRATLPDRRRVFAYHTDADLPSARQACHPRGFTALLDATHAIDLPQVSTTELIVRASARSQVLNRTFGHDWCAVGDAACAFDPLSSQGLFHALYTGVRGAEAGIKVMKRDFEALPAYGCQLAQIVDSYCANLVRFYRLEGRFGDNPFWARRRVSLGKAVAERLAIENIT